MSQYSAFFQFPFCSGGATGRELSGDDDQDQVVCCPDISFFAVVSGKKGGSNDAREMGQALRDVASTLVTYVENLSKSVLLLIPGSDGGLIQKAVEKISDKMYAALGAKAIRFEITLACVWLVRNYAVFVNLGDCRAYFLQKYSRDLRQITFDDDTAQALFDKETLTEQGSAVCSGPDSRLKRFVGMNPPAKADWFFEQVKPGDHILLCNKGLYSQMKGAQMAKVLRGGHSAQAVLNRLVSASQDNGGISSVSAVYIHIQKDSAPLRTPYGELLQSLTETGGEGKGFAANMIIQVREKGSTP